MVLRRRHLLFAGLVLGLLLAGCGGIADEDDPGAGSFYQLDPPELGLGDAPARGLGVPVLCYHYFRSGFDAGYLVKVLGSVLFGMPALGPREFWTTPVGEFEKHLRHFRDTGTRVMSLDEVAALVDAGRPLPERAVVLTIDDADRSVYELAWPLLKKYGMRAHLFVPTAHVGSKWSELEVSTWQELREMEESGAIILGSHTRDLHFKVDTPDGPEPIFWNPAMVEPEHRKRSYSELSRRRREAADTAPPGTQELLASRWAPVAADLLASRYALAAEAGADPAWLAWPYGFAHVTLDSVARVVGFRGTVSLEPHSFAASDTVPHVGRYTLTAKTTVDMIAGILAPVPAVSPSP